VAWGIGSIRQASTVVRRREFANNFMRNYYSTTIVEIISLVVAGSFLGTISGYFTESFLVTVATYLGITLWQRNRFYSWVSDQQKPGSLDASDLWSDVIKRIEIERASVDQKAELISKNLTDLNKGIGGLNLGVVVADSNWELQWLNRPAERLLGLNESTDRGSFLFSLIRSPSFKRYVESKTFVYDGLDFSF
jgi:two-component system phosphate regulon sensor histidine kinase PhoR